MGNLYTRHNISEKNECMVQAIYIAMIMPNGWSDVNNQIYKRCLESAELYEKNKDNPLDRPIK